MRGREAEREAEKVPSKGSNLWDKKRLRILNDYRSPIAPPPLYEPSTSTQTHCPPIPGLVRFKEAGEASRGATPLSPLSQPAPRVAGRHVMRH